MALQDYPRGSSARPERPERSSANVIPQKVKERLDRGRKDMKRDASKRRLCMRFERGDTYWYVTEKGVLNFQPTITSVNGTGKPPHRIRNRYNFIRPIVENKVSQATQRVPSYEVTPATTDPEDIGAARLSEKVALYGYDKWRLRDVTVDCVKLAIAGGGEAFALPYFEPNVGPYVPVAGEDGKPFMQGLGEVRVLVLSRNEVGWEPGCRFEESPWWFTERARPIDNVEDDLGYLPGLALQPDASVSDVPTDRAESERLVMVTEYFERPSPKNPKGMRLCIANGRLISTREDYPLTDTEGAVLDEPLLHRLRYTHDPDSDNDFGLVWQLIDFQRTVQDCYNKLLEYKNRGLMPQLIAPVGSQVTRRTDEPGATTYYKPVANLKPEWEPAVQVPEALFRILEQAKQDMRDVAGDQVIQADPNVAARTVGAVIEQAQARWQSFLGDLAEWHSRVMRHCLMLVERYYTEPRLLQINGRTGPYLVRDFRGAQLSGQVDVRVLPGSLEARSRQQIMNELQWIVTNFPGYLSPEVVIAALHGGTAEKLIESYELDVSRANRIIERIRDGSVMEMPTRMDTDPATGEQQDIPSWMPEKDIDNLDIWQKLFSDWAKTEEFDRLDPGLQEVARLVLAGIKDLKFREAQEQAELQSAMAESQGMANAAKPQGPKPMPDQPSPNTDGPPSPNQAPA